MRRARLLVFGFLCLLIAVPLWGQVPPNPNPVYVSGGPYIYNVQGSTLVKVYDATQSASTYNVGTLKGIKTTSKQYAGPYFTSLAIGPDNAATDQDAYGNAKYPFLIYACDDHTGTIIRFAPSFATTFTANPEVEVIFNGQSSPAIKPVCGRFTSTGDFYVTDDSSTSSASSVTVFKFASLANTALGSVGAVLNATGVGLSVAATSAVNAGITQKNVGDLLLVDHTNNQVLRSPYGTPFSTVSSPAYITNGLSSPVGIARISTGDVFVGNAGTSNVAHFNSAGAPATGACPSLSFPAGPDQHIAYLAASETDTIYAVTSPSDSSDGKEDMDFVPESDHPGEVWNWSSGACTLQAVALSKTELFGVAVAPIPTAPITEAVSSPIPPANPSPTPFVFNSSEFQITANGCTATVTAYPISLVNVNTMIGKANANGLPDGATPVANLGEDGYEIAYVAHWPATGVGACQSVFPDNTSIANAIFGFYDPSTVVNPRIVRCDSNPVDDANEPLLDGTNTCTSLTTIGSYPVGGPLAGDPGTVGKGPSGSVFVLVNANGSTSAGVAGNFCGFASPLVNTTNPTTATTLDTDDFLPIAFQLVQTGGNCKAGLFIGNASAILSIAEIADGDGNPAFNQIFNIKTLFNNGASFPQPATCKYFPNTIAACTYALFLDVHGSGLGPGTYELSVLFLTDNASIQTVVFKVVPEGTDPF